MPKAKKSGLENIERTRNTSDMLDFYSELSDFVASVDMPDIEKMFSFPVFATRQSITRLIERYEIYKLIETVPGTILDTGTGSGFGLMAFAHFCTIFEGYNYTRRLVGFDTFEGFTEPAPQDRTSKAAHMKKGGLAFDSYEILQRAIAIHDRNRVLGHIPKVEVIKGNISDTLPAYIEANPHLVVALLYLDMDLYRPTKDTIELLVPRIPRGGVIVFDEINHADYPGETTAVMETLGLSNLRLRRLPISSTASFAIVE